MAMVDHFRIIELDLGGELPKAEQINWEPKSPQLRELIQLLLDPKRIPILKAWYKKPYKMNHSAESLRNWLSIATGEQLG